MIPIHISGANSALVEKVKQPRVQEKIRARATKKSGAQVDKIEILFKANTVAIGNRHVYEGSVYAYVKGKAVKIGRILVPKIVNAAPFTETQEVWAVR